MALRPDQERIKSLLSETITLLCRNGLNFKSEFSIEALIGITLDHSDVFLVNIKETVKLPEQIASSSEVGCAWEDAVEKQFSIDGSTKMNLFNESKRDMVGIRTAKRTDSSKNSFNRSGSYIMGRGSADISREIRLGVIDEQKSVRLGANNEACGSSMKRARMDSVEGGDEREKTLVSKREIGEKLKEYEIDQSSKTYLSPRCSPGINDLNVMHKFSLNRLHSQSTDDQEVQRGETDQQSIVPYTGARLDEKSQIVGLGDGGDFDANTDDTNDIVFVKNEPNEFEMHETFDVNGTHDQRIGEAADLWGVDTDIRFGKSKQTNDATLRPSWLSTRRQQDCRPRLKRQFTDATGSPYEYNGLEMNLVCDMSPSMIAGPTSNYSLPRSEPPCTTGAPDLSDDELVIARSVLSMRGCFISLGCLKANRQLIRRVSREHLIAIINKMSMPTDPAYFIGLLCDFGVSKVFYKCPPESVSVVALSFYGFSGARYKDCFVCEVIVDKNIRDPVSWIQRFQERSPFVRL